MTFTVHCADCHAEYEQGADRSGETKTPTCCGVCGSKWIAVKNDAGEVDRWIPACGGTEVPFTARNGRKLLYCYQPLTGNHAYLDCGTDMILTDIEALAALGIFQEVK